MAMKDPVDELYVQHVKPLPADQRLRLLEKIAQDLADTPGARRQRSIMELHGLGKEIWEDVDPQGYVNQLRDEWDERP
ncbi:MAG: hypothetical protein LC754_18925 [Acidobacteria bacterium]|nr:hypothetical protein [Acidobacteriota bacterium]